MKSLPTETSIAVANVAELPPILNKGHLAALFFCTTRHIDNLTRRGIIPSFHLGRSIRYRRDAVLSAVKRLEGGI